MLHKNIVHDLFVSYLRLYIMKRKVKGLMLFLFLTQLLDIFFNTLYKSNNEGQ